LKETFLAAAASVDRAESNRMEDEADGISDKFLQERRWPLSLIVSPNNVLEQLERRGFIWGRKIKNSFQLVIGSNFNFFCHLLFILDFKKR
jgi:hypothetical protein